MAYTVGIALALLSFQYVPASAAALQWFNVFMIGFFLYGPQMLIGLCGAELVGPDSVGASEGFLGWIAYLGELLARMVLIRVAAFMVLSIRYCNIGHFWVCFQEEQVCTELFELVGPDSVGASEGFLGWIAYLGECGCCTCACNNEWLSPKQQSVTLSFLCAFSRDCIC
jgi:sugar phosphate permease